jgi:hypothetical protein
MDCCGHEGHAAGDARFDIKQVADGIHVAVAAPAYKVNSNTAIIESDGGVIVVDTHSNVCRSRDRGAAAGDHREARAVRREHAFPLGPLARQRSLPAGLSGRGDRDQSDHA